MNSIRQTLTRSVALTVLSVCCVMFVGLLLLMRAKLIEQFDLSLLNTAETLGGLLQIEEGKLGFDENDEALIEFRRPSRPAYFDIRDMNGKSLLRSASLPASMSGLNFPTRKAVAIRLPDQTSGRVIGITIVPRVEVDEQTTAMRAVPIFVFVARDTADIDRTLQWLAISMGIVLLAMGVIILVLIPWLVRRGLQPLDRLSERAAAISVHNLDPQFPTHNIPSELAPISQRLNESLTRLRDAFSRERRFASDAAHELRTPLAAIRANAEVAQKWPDPQQVQTSLADITTSVIRLQTLIERLLELARSGHGSTSAGVSRVDLLQLLRDGIARLGEQRSRVTLHAEQSVLIHTQPDLLASLVDNLLCNAIAHSPATSVVIVTLSAGESWQITIRNAAPNLQSSDLDRMFDPLWTKSPDRSAGHAGLGLALVAECARALGLSVTPKLDAEEYLSMSIIVA